MGTEIRPSGQKVELIPFQAERQAGIKAQKNGTWHVRETTGVSLRLEVDFEARSNWTEVRGQHKEVDLLLLSRGYSAGNNHNTQRAMIKCLLRT